VPGQTPSPLRAPAPFFVIGAPRSGTTLLYKAFCLHRGAAWISNYQRRLPALPEAAVIVRAVRHDRDRRRRFWFGGDGGSAYAYQRRRPVLERLYPVPVEGEPVFARAGLRADRPNERSAVDVGALRSLVARTARAAGGRLVSKRIGHNLRLPILADAFPDARFLVVTRDGRAVADSLLRVDWWPTSTVWWYGDTPAAWAAQGGEPVELAARHWLRELEVIDDGLAAVDAELVVRLRYEDVIADPIGRLAEAATFAGLGPDERWLGELGALQYPDQNEGWRQRLDGDRRNLVEEIQRPVLVAHGYLPPAGR